MTSVRSIAWVAGLWEGEGYFTFSKRSLLMVLDSTDEDVVRRAASIMRTRVYGPYANGVSAKTGVSHKTKWRVQLNGKRAAEWMMTIWSELGHRRRQTVKACLAAWLSTPPWRADRTLCVRGHALSGENLRVNKKGERQCRACERSRMRISRSLTAPNTEKVRG